MDALRVHQLEYNHCHHNEVAGGVLHLAYCYRHCFRLASPSYDRTCEYALYYRCYCVESQGKRTHKMHELRVAIACCAVLIGRGVVHPLCPVRCALPLYIRSAVVIPPAPRVRCVLPLCIRSAVVPPLRPVRCALLMCIRTAVW